MQSSLYMNLFKKLRGEFIDIIEQLNQDFPEISNAERLETIQSQVRNKLKLQSFTNPQLTEIAKFPLFKNTVEKSRYTKKTRPCQSSRKTRRR